MGSGIGTASGFPSDKTSIPSVYSNAVTPVLEKHQSPENHLIQLSSNFVVRESVSLGKIKRPSNGLVERVLDTVKFLIGLVASHYWPDF